MFYPVNPECWRGRTDSHIRPHGRTHAHTRTPVYLHAHTILLGTYERIDIRTHVRTEANTKVQTWKLEVRS